MVRSTNRLDDDWSDNIGCDYPDLWNPPDWAENQWMALHPKERAARRRVRQPATRRTDGHGSLGERE